MSLEEQKVKEKIEFEYRKTSCFSHLNEYLDFNIYKLLSV